MRSPRRVLGGAVAGVVVIAGVGWTVGTQLRSPADEAALRAAPRPSLVTAPVVKRKLTSTVAVNGTLEYGSPLPISLAGMVGTGSGAAQPSAQLAQRVTRAPRRGELTEGEVLMEVNGRPVSALIGSVPMHRTIGPGTSGPDVRQLQRALRRLGYGGPSSGVFDGATAAAVKRWYSKRGYRAQEPDFATRQTVDTLRKAVQAAEETLLTDRAALKAAEDVKLLTAKLAGARATLRAAERALEAAGKGASDDDGETVDPAQLRAAVLTAKEAVLAAEQELRRARDTSALRLKVANGGKNLASAKANLAEYLKSYGVGVPPGEIVFLPKLPARLDKTSVKAGEPAEGTIGTVTSSEFAVAGSVDDQEAELLRTGLKAVIETDGGKTYPARLTAMGAEARVEEEKAQAAGDDGPDLASVPVLLTPTGTKGLRELVGVPVTVRITVGETEGEVLTVPVAAVVTSADGKPRVQVEYAADRTRDVQIRTGLTADGQVQVTGKLTEGDRVVIGNG